MLRQTYFTACGSARGGGGEEEGEEGEGRRRGRGRGGGGGGGGGEGEGVSNGMGILLSTTAFMTPSQQQTSKCYSKLMVRTGTRCASSSNALQQAKYLSGVGLEVEVVPPALGICPPRQLLRHSTPLDSSYSSGRGGEGRGGWDGVGRGREGRGGEGRGGEGKGGEGWGGSVIAGGYWFIL